MAEKGRRRPLVNSTDRTLAIHENIALGPLEPPEGVTLRPGDLPFWLGVLEARARDDWPENDLRVAAGLARALADVESESLRLDAEGHVIGDKVNPRFVTVEALHRRVGSLMRLLRMGGSPAGNSYDEGKRRGKEREIEKQARELGNEKEGKAGTGANIYRLLA